MDLVVWLTIAVILLLLVCSAYFSGSETALTATSRARLHHLETEGNRRARLAHRLMNERERLIGTILVGNNLVNILASSLATSVLIRLFGDAGVAYATVIMTLIIVIYCEVLPKSYAIRNADRVAMRVAPSMRLLMMVLRPVTATLMVVVHTTQRLLGLDRHAISGTIAREELKGAFALHARHGGIVKDERAMLNSVLDLAEVEVGQVMTHRRSIRMIDAATPPAELIDAVLRSGHMRMPLWEDEPDNIVGIIHAKDVLRAAREQGGRLDAIDVRTVAKDPWFVPDTTTLTEQLEAFRRRKEHFALVVDEYGSLMGLITLEDILEEIVGEFEDEYDLPVLGVTPHPDGSFTMDGTVPIRNLNREFGWRLPEDEAATIAGLVIHEAREIPTVGQTFAFHGLRFVVLARQRNHVSSLKVTPIAPPPEAEA
ncbi:MAG: HlyC/CorC family transporter [Alphaproteobacteria bacterium]|nr:HlyC/CorC family transporter [Alphaproteobacteria bacterium]